MLLFCQITISVVILSQIRFLYYKKIKNNKFKIIRSMRFEYYLSLLKNSNFIVGNSSSGIMEAPYYGVPTIDLGSRQKIGQRLILSFL